MGGAEVYIVHEALLRIHTKKGLGLLKEHVFNVFEAT